MAVRTVRADWQLIGYKWLCSDHLIAVSLY